jgi:hypothetical protein
MKKWCNNNFLNYETINKFLLNYFYYQTIFLSLYDDMKKLSNNLVSDSINDDKNTNIIKCFFQSNGRNIKVAYYLRDSVIEQPFFYIFHQSDVHLIGACKSISRKKYDRESVVNKYSDIIMYHNAEAKKDREDYQIETDDGKSNQNIIELGIISNIDKFWLTSILPHIFNKKITRKSNTKYEIVNRVGNEILNNLNINNISYLVDINDKILKKYYIEFMMKIREFIGGSNKLKSFNISKLKNNKTLYNIIKYSSKYNILNIINRIYIKENNNNVLEIYGKTFNNIYYKFL